MARAGVMTQTSWTHVLLYVVFLSPGVPLLVWLIVLIDMLSRVFSVLSPVFVCSFLLLGVFFVGPGLCVCLSNYLFRTVFLLLAHVCVFLVCSMCVCVSFSTVFLFFKARCYLLF